MEPLPGGRDRIEGDGSLSQGVLGWTGKTGMIRCENCGHCEHCETTLVALDGSGWLLKALDGSWFVTLQ